MGRGQQTRLQRCSQVRDDVFNTAPFPLTEAVVVLHRLQHVDTLPYNQAKRGFHREACGCRETPRKRLGT
jgi:hypothetical protein